MFVSYFETLEDAIEAGFWLWHDLTDGKALVLAVNNQDETLPGYRLGIVGRAFG